MVLNLKIVARTLGALLVFLGVALLGPMAVGLIYGEAAWWDFAVAALLALGLGGGAWVAFGGVTGRPADLGVREGMAIVALSWLLLSLIGALPFVLGGVLGSYTDAFFETMSAFTTTGATILGGPDTPMIEALPQAHLFWRSLAHWLGGMGIIVLTLAILPILGVGGMQLYKAEVPGPSTDKLTPRIRETAKRLWFIYVGFTAAHLLLLLPAMPFFDAINHAFSTMATGGFSTRSASIGYYDSAYVDAVVIVFMFLAGVSFALHYRLLTGRRLSVFKNTELKAYAGIVATATAFVMLATWRPTAELLPLIGEGVTSFEGYGSLLEALRYALFQVLAIVTTTGFGTADYMLWPPLAVGTIFLLFFVGGMAGSTGGGIKVIRHVLLYRNAMRELKQLIHPRAVLPLRVGGAVVPPDVLRNVLSFIVLYFLLIAVGTAAMAFLGIDLLSAFGATISSIGNIGPAFGLFGPAENYAAVPAPGKWILALLMMAGRLEIFTVLVLLLPVFWRR